jgi:hypothetical protein
LRTVFLVSTIYSARRTALSHAFSFKNDSSFFGESPIVILTEIFGIVSTLYEEEMILFF